MSLLHLRFYSAFTLTGLGLALHPTPLISSLLCLESTMLSMYISRYQSDLWKTKLRHSP